MNGQSIWRKQFATYVAQAYAAEPTVDAVLIAGSVARGHADKFSDANLRVFWQKPPTDVLRKRILQRIIADAKSVHSFEPSQQLWRETCFVGRAEPQAEVSGLPIEIAGHTVDRAQLILEDVQERCDPDFLKQNFISDIQHGIPIKGNQILDAWKEQARAYPDSLARAVVLRHGHIENYWQWRMYLDRNSRFMFDNHIAEVQKKILLMLLAVNRIYYFGFNWPSVIISQFTRAPADLANRFTQITEFAPELAAESLRILVEETCDLVDQYVPGVPVARLREQFRRQQPQWDTQPPPVHPPKIL